MLLSLTLIPTVFAIGSNRSELGTKVGRVFAHNGHRHRPWFIRINHGGLHASAIVMN